MLGGPELKWPLVEGSTVTVSSVSPSAIAE